MSVNDAILGELDFFTKVAPNNKNIGATAEVLPRQFKKVFISYAHDDIETVKHYAEAYRVQGTDYFFDRHSLKPGDVYDEVIKNFIREADLFLLIWSENAKRSKYVPIECDIAMELTYPHIPKEQATLSIRPISIEPHASLPEKINKIYNFEKV